MILQNWDAYSQTIELDWERLQTEYRDCLDIAKLMQFLPVVGAVAGGFANNNLMKRLKINAVNAYRMRALSSGGKEYAKEN